MTQGEPTAVLLLSGAVRIDPKMLGAALDEAVAAEGLTFSRQPCREGITHRCARLSATVSGQGEPYDCPSLRAASVISYGQTMGDPLDAALARHDGALLIRVDPCAPTAPSDPRANSEAGADLARHVAHGAASQLARHNAAALEGVYWPASEQVIGARRFLVMAQMRYPLPLFLHPVPRPSGHAPCGTARVGLDLHGAAAILGHGLRVAPAAAPVDWLAARALAFAAYLRAGGTPLKAGDTFGTEPGEAFEIAIEEDRTVLMTLLMRPT